MHIGMCTLFFLNATGPRLGSFQGFVYFSALSMFKYSTVFVQFCYSFISKPFIVWSSSGLLISWFSENHLSFLFPCPVGPGRAVSMAFCSFILLQRRTRTVLSILRAWPGVGENLERVGPGRAG